LERLSLRRREGSSAIESRFDLLGILVLAFCIALGGGIVRDLLIGESGGSNQVRRGCVWTRVNYG